MRISLNTIKQRLLDFANGHAQLNTVTYLDDADFNAQRDLTYPACNVEYRNSTVSGKLINHTFRVTLADLIDDNVPGIEDEIYSDMLLVADDLTSFLQYQEDWEFLRSVRIEHFTDDTGDRTAGLVFDVTVSTMRRQCPDLTPLKQMT